MAEPIGQNRGAKHVLYFAPGDITMETSASLKVSEPGVAAPKYSRDVALGSALHKAALAIARPRYRGHSRIIARRINKKFCQKAAYITTRRHFATRLANFVKFMRERERVDRVSYYPPIITLEPNSKCNLQCPGCTTGINHPNRKAGGLARLETMRRILHEAYRYTMQVQFYNWGEPLLNDDFYIACREAADLGLWTTTHSNLSLKVPLAERLLRSGLNELVVSCDGATQETYEKYRRGGNVDWVFENIMRIRKARDKAKTTFPWISAKMLIFDHNWHEIENFQDRAQAAGADEVLFAAGGMGGMYRTERVATGKDFDLETLNWISRPLSPRCSEVWGGMTIDFDGSVFPCCMAFREKDLFVTADQATRETLMESWNSAHYINVRRYFTGRAESRNLHSICRECGLVGAYARTHAKQHE